MLRGRWISALSEQIARVSEERRRKKPQGEILRLHGLSRPVELYRDEAGVPHLYAATRLDAYLAQGWVVAKERAFQLDFSRRAMAGRLAEVLGRRPVGWEALTIHLKDRSIPDADRLLRTLGLRRAAERSLEHISPEGRAVLDAYASGVSQAFAGMKRRAPLEMRLLGYRPEPWQPADSLAIVKGMAFELSFAWRSVLLYDAIAQRLGDDPERLRELFPEWPDHAPPPAAWNALRRENAGTVELEERFRAFTATGGAHIGSNAWVIAGSKTASGAPLLAGDPHLMLTAPSPHFAIHLCSPGFEVAGSSVPGVPGIVIGHNREIAWTMTAACGSDADVFVEELDLERRVYKAGGEWLPLKTRVEEITIKGEPPLRVEVHETRHGPLIQEVTHALGRKKTGFGHALRWTGQDASADFDGLLRIQTASNWREFREALSHLVAPALNFVYADRAGHIGWQLAGAFPVRRDGSDGRLPSDGASDAAGWVRYLALDELPHLYDPPTGVIVSANTKPVDAAYPWPLGSTWEPPHRYRRIQSLIASRGEKRKLTVEDCAAIQLDQRSLWAEGVLERFFRPALAGVDLGDPLENKAAKLLLEWDGVAAATSAAAAIFYHAYDDLLHASLRAELGDDVLIAYLELLNVSILPFERLLDAEDPPLLPRRDRPRRAAAAIRAAVTKLSAAQGKDPERWRWGESHVLWHRHRMHEVRALRTLLSIGPFALGGDGLCVNNAHYHHSKPFEVLIGPGLRIISDLSSWDRTRFVLSTGVSGNPASPRYRDHASLWSQGRYFALRFGEDGRVGPPDLLVP